MSTASISGRAVAALVALVVAFPFLSAAGAPGAPFTKQAAGAFTKQAAGAGAAGAPGEEACLVSRINDSRQAAGLSSLSVHSGLVSIARRHSQWMIDNLGPRSWQHNSNLVNELPDGWITRGENVGWATDCNHMQNFFINSPPHRKNMLNPAFNYVGVGVLVDAQGELRVTEVFMQAGGANTPAPAAAPKPPVTSNPAPTTAAPKPAPKVSPAPTVNPTPTPAAKAKTAPAQRVAVRTRAFQDILESEPQTGELDVYFEVLSPPATSRK